MRSLWRSVPDSRPLSHGYEPVSRSGGDVDGVRAEIGRRHKPRTGQVRIQLVPRPALHHETVIAGALLPMVIQGMTLRQHELPIVRVEFSHAGERERPAVRRNSLAKNRFPGLARRRSGPFADIKNEHATRPKRAVEDRKHGSTSGLAEKIVQYTTAEYRVVSREGIFQKVPNSKGRRTGGAVSRAESLCDELWGPVNAVNDIPV